MLLFGVVLLVEMQQIHHWLQRDTGKYNTFCFPGWMQYFVTSITQTHALTWYLIAVSATCWGNVAEQENISPSTLHHWNPFDMFWSLYNNPNLSTGCHPKICKCFLLGQFYLTKATVWFGKPVEWLLSDNSKQSHHWFFWPKVLLFGVVLEVKSAWRWILILGCFM